MERDILKKIAKNFETKKGFVNKIFNTYLLNKLEYKDYFDRFDETCVFIEFCKHHSVDDILKLLNKMEKADIDLSYHFDQYTRYDAKLFENLLNEIDSNKMEIIINKLPESFFKKKFDGYDGFERFKKNVYQKSEKHTEIFKSLFLSEDDSDKQKLKDLKKEIAKFNLSKMILLRDKVSSECVEHMVMDRNFKGSFIEKEFNGLYINLEKEDQLKLISMLDLKNSDWMVFFENIKNQLAFANKKTEDNLKLIIQHINKIENKALTGKMLLSYLDHWENDPRNAKNKDIGYSVQEIGIFNTIFKENGTKNYEIITYPSLIKEIIAEKPESSMITDHEKVAINIILKDLFNLSGSCIEREKFQSFVNEALEIYPELFNDKNLPYIDEQFKKIKMYITNSEDYDGMIMISEHSFDSDIYLRLNVLNLALKLEDKNLINNVKNYYIKNKERINESQLFDLYYYTDHSLIKNIRETFITKSDHTSFFILSKESQKIIPYYKEEIVSLYSYVNFLSNRRDFSINKLEEFIDINSIIRNGCKNENEYSDRIVSLYNELNKMKNDLGEYRGEPAPAYSRKNQKDKLNRKILNAIEKDLTALYEKEVIGDIINNSDKIENKTQRRL